MKLNLLISFGSSLKEHIIIMGNSLGKRLVIVYCICIVWGLVVRYFLFPSYKQKAPLLGGA